MPEEKSRFQLLEVDLSPEEREAWRVRQLQKSVVGQLQLQEERAAQGNWFPACGGTEVPFKSRSGRVLLYCWQPSSGRHAYIDCSSDEVLSDEHAQLALGK
jgi:hypothetical protein